MRFLRWNEAARGGGLYNGIGASTHLARGHIIDNRATSQGGGVYIRDGTVRIDAQGFVQGNNAPFVLSSGGGIYRNGGTLHGDGSGDCEVHEGGNVCFNEPDNIAP